MKTCGTCQQWQLIDVQQLADYPSDANRPFDIGRCRTHSQGRYRGESPMGDCHVPVATAKQEYGQERKV